MKYDPKRHHRRSIRLKGYDYTQPGAYFVTICTHERKCLFGHVLNGKMVLNVFGKIAHQCWLAIPDHFPHARLDEFVIMPNHVHGIIWIVESSNRGNVGSRHAVSLPCTRSRQYHMSQRKIEQFGRPVPGSIPTIIRSYKSAVTKRINEMRNATGVSIWQRNYYEHIVRNEYELNRIREYIVNNPLKWSMDRQNPLSNRVSRR